MASNPHSPSRRARYPAVLVCAGYLAAVAALVCYALASGDRRFLARGDAYPGTLTAVAEPVGYFTAALAGAMCLGAMVYIVITARPDHEHVIDAGLFRVHLFAEKLSVLWLVTAAVMVAVEAANDCGVALTRLVRGEQILDAISSSEMSRGWIAVVVCAAIVAVSLRLTVRWVAHCVLVVPTAIGVIALPVTGNAGQGPDHDYATSAVIVFAFAIAATAGLKVAAALRPPTPATRRRLLTTVVCCESVALCYGAVLMSLLAGPGWPTDSDYDRLGVLAGTVLALLLLTDIAALRTSRGGQTKAAVDATVMIAVLAATAAMAVQTAPRLLAHQFTVWDVFLGYQLPGPPTAVRILTVWRFDTLIGTAALVAAGAYAAGVVRLRRRGDDWPWGRLAAWLAGCATLVFASGSGIRAYGSAMFSVHMAEHMALNMFIPVLLVLGGPVTLALRALPAAGDGQQPGPREWLTWLVHSRVTVFLSHPATAFILFVGSLYAVYFTPLFDTLVRYHWGHEFMGIHFLLVGYLFFWGIIGIDPGPRRLPFLGRLGLLFAVMPFHAFFGIATMTMTSAIGGTFYRYVNLPWVSSISGDQHLGGAIAWSSGELPLIMVVVALVAQWAHEDRRTATRIDRHADSGYGDDDLDAYNAMLRELSGPRR